MVNCCIFDELLRLKFDLLEVLKGFIMFISMIDVGWIVVERWFDKMIVKIGGLLDLLNFGECLGKLNCIIIYSLYIFY